MRALMRPIRRFVLPLLLSLPCVLTLPACGERPAAGDTDVSVEDSAGVRMVRNGPVGAWGGDASPVIVEQLRIGVVEGEDSYQLYQVYSLALDEEGALYVGNNQTATVRVFSPDGEFLREFGGRGQGPGEYNMVNRVWLAGDSVAITDWQRGRTGIYTKAGELAAFWQSMRPDGSRILPTARTPAGWLASVSPPYRPPALADGERWERQVGLAFYDPVGDSVGPPVVPLPPSVLYGSSQTEGLDWSLFQPRSSYAVDAAGRVFIAFGDPYRIEVRRSDGTLERVITRVHTPVPVGDEDVEELKALIAARWDTSSSPSAQQQKERVTARVERQRGFDPRPTLPPTGTLLVSHDGSFWVERTDVATPAELEYERLYGSFNRRAPRPTRWDLFDAEGRLLTTVDLPARFQPMAVRGTEVAGVFKDELDVEYVVVYRIRPAAAGERT